MNTQLPPETMRKAVRGLLYISHPLRLRILEYLDVNGVSSVSEITGGIAAEQVFVSQSLRKLRDAALVKAERRGIFIYYKIYEEYPASLFHCLRKLYGYMTGNFRYLADDVKLPLPRDYLNMAANQIKLFANFDKMRILEFLSLNGETSVSELISGVNADQIKVSQYLKRLKDDGFVSCRREGRFMYYTITKGVHKTAIDCIHRRFDQLVDKSDF